MDSLWNAYVTWQVHTVHTWKRTYMEKNRHDFCKIFHNWQCNERLCHQVGKMQKTNQIIWRKNLRLHEMSQTNFVIDCLSVFSCHVRYSCLNVKELIAWNRRHIWQIDELFSVFRDLTGSFLERNWKLHLSSVRRAKSIFFSFSLYKLYSMETSLLWRSSQRFLRFTINL